MAQRSPKMPSELIKESSSSTHIPQLPSFSLSSNSLNHVTDICT